MRRSLIAFFSSFVLRCLGAATMVARNAASNCWNKASAGFAVFSSSRNVQIVLLSGTASANPKPRKTHERQAVIDQIFATFVRQRVRRLQDQNLEHEHMIERRPTALRVVTARDCGFERRPEHLKIDRHFNAFQIVTFGRQLRQAFVCPSSKNPDAHLAMSAILLQHDKVNQANAGLARGFWRRPDALP
jgi:hypothetical protein